MKWNRQIGARWFQNFMEKVKKKSTFVHWKVLLHHLVAFICATSKGTFNVHKPKCILGSVVLLKSWFDSEPLWSQAAGFVFGRSKIGVKQPISETRRSTGSADALVFIIFIIMYPGSTQWDSRNHSSHVESATISKSSTLLNVGLCEVPKGINSDRTTASCFYFGVLPDIWPFMICSAETFERHGSSIATPMTSRWRSGTTTYELETVGF